MRDMHNKLGDILIDTIGKPSRGYLYTNEDYTWGQQYMGIDFKAHTRTGFNPWINIMNINPNYEHWRTF